MRGMGAFTARPAARARRLRCGFFPCPTTGRAHARFLAAAGRTARDRASPRIEQAGRRRGESEILLGGARGTRAPGHRVDCRPSPLVPCRPASTAKSLDKPLPSRNAAGFRAGLERRRPGHCARRSARVSPHLGEEAQVPGTTGNDVEQTGPLALEGSLEQFTKPVEVGIRRMAARPGACPIR